MGNVKKRIDSAVDAVLASIILAMTAVIVISVFYRYVLNMPLSWTDEIARIMIVWLSFVGGYMALREGKHIGFDLVVKKLAPPVRAAVEVVAQAAVLVFLVVVVWQGFIFAGKFLNTPMEYTQIPLGWVAYSTIPVSGLLMGAQTLVNLVRSLKAGRGTGGPR
jgi:TRAP-type C4-dicarboxylate transport system permease small subunit